MNRAIKYFLTAGFLFLIFIGKNEKISAQDADYKAYTLFLYNFMKYIEWPDPTGDFVIGVMGDSPIKNDLKTLSENKKAKGRKIVVKILATADDAAGCNMIYIP